MKGKKNTKKTSKKQKSEETPLVPTPLTIVDEKKVVEEEAQQLYNQVSEINQQFINEGNTILLEKLPQKIQQLSEFIKNQPLFYVSMDEIKKEICKTVDESIALCKETRKEVIQYKKDLNKSFNKWRKDEHAICSNLKKPHNSIQTQVAFEKLEDMINQDHIFSINKNLQELTDYIMNEVKESIPLLSSLSLMIELKTPRLENGNNFGVEIQKEALQEITQTSEQMDNIIDALIKYYSLRGAAAAHCIDKPYLMDIFQTLIEVDTAQFYTLKLFIKSIRDLYATIYDTMIKNYDKIMNPRHSNDGTSSFF